MREKMRKNKWQKGKNYGYYSSNILIADIKSFKLSLLLIISVDWLINY